MANPNLELKVTFRWWLYPSLYLYVLWCKFWCIIPNIENNQFFKSGIIIIPESKTK